MKKIYPLLFLLICFIILKPFEAAAAEINVPASEEEMRGVWFAYYDYKPKECPDADSFNTFISKAFDNIAALGMNAVFVHVRSHSDAMYPSKYYPWSRYASGEQGVNPGYDPLAIMVEAAHARNLKIHAWINPYRVTGSGTDPLKLAKSNPARKYLTNSKTTDDRYVLAYDNQLYYNPSKTAVRNLIVNGVREIVENYAVDGIHFDDYFYPAFNIKKYETAFDAPEYETYAAAQVEKGKKPKDIAKWRKSNVNKLISEVYSAIKEINPDCVFGISPGGYIDYYDDVNRWYVDYRTWMSKPGYIDYICPQLYWSFSTLNIYPYYETLLKWENALTLPGIKLYAGLPAYKMNTNTKLSSELRDTEWYNQFTLANMITTGRSTDKFNGVLFFDYADVVSSRNKAAMELVTQCFDR